MRTAVAGVLLAAGEGSRFGQPKALVELDGQTLVERGVKTLLAGGADPIFVVAGAAPLDLDRMHSVYNQQWRTGMGSSLRVACEPLTENWNQNPRPFMWTKTAEEILDSLAKYIARISGAGH